MGRATSRTLDQYTDLARLAPGKSDEALFLLTVATAINELTFTLRERLGPKTVNEERENDDFVDFVFREEKAGAGPPDMVFVEVEDSDGKSFRAGEWIRRENGRWALRVPLPL